MYIPPQATNIEDTPRTLIVGILGPPGSGKTSAALTFPNPIMIRYDRTDIKGLLTVEHLKDVKPLELKFHSPKFITETLKFPLTKNGRLVDRMESLVVWLRTEGMKLTSEQTLIFDSWSTFQDACYEIIFDDTEKVYAKGSGAEDSRKPWARLNSISVEVTALLGGLSCNVVVLFHQMQERADDGRMLDKIQPLQQGKFVTKLKNYYPYFVRQVCQSPRDAQGKPKEGERPEYLWQVRSTDSFDCKFIGKPDRPMYVKAEYRSLI